MSESDEAVVDAFAHALLARGMVLDQEPDTPEDFRWADHMDRKAAQVATSWGDWPSACCPPTDRYDCRSSTPGQLGPDRHPSHSALTETTRLQVVSLTVRRPGRAHLAA